MRLRVSRSCWVTVAKLLSTRRRLASFSATRSQASLCASSHIARVIFSTSPSISSLVIGHCLEGRFLSMQNGFPQVIYRPHPERPHCFPNLRLVIGEPCNRRELPVARL